MAEADRQPLGDVAVPNEAGAIVVSTTLAEDDLGWENSSILRGLDDIVRALKEQDGADIVINSLVHVARCWSPAWSIPLLAIIRSWSARAARSSGGNWS